MPVSRPPSYPTASNKSYRSSWNPAWMDNADWLNNVDVTQYFDDAMQQSGSEYEESSSDEDNDVKNDSFDNVESGSDDDGEEAGVQRLLNIFAFAAKAVVQATPWASPALTKPVRKQLLGVLIKKTIDRSASPQLLGKYIKEYLRMIQSEDVTTELLGHHISFMTVYPGPRSEGDDTYRTLTNFKGSYKGLSDFHENCIEKIQDRLKQINGDLGKSEAKATRAILHWHDLHAAATQPAHAACFGNSLTVLVHELALVDGDTSDDELDKGVLVEMDNDVEVLHTTSHTLNSGKLTTLSAKKLSIKVNVSFDGVMDADQEIAKASGSNAAPIPSRDGQRLRWEQPRCLGFFVGHGGRTASKAMLHVTIYKKRLFSGFSCTSSDDKPLAAFKIPLIDALYAEVTPFDDPSRFKKGPLENSGIHFSHLRIEDPSRQFRLVLDVAMSCLEPLHNERPPPIDIVEEEQRRRVMASAVREDVWHMDHHKTFLNLADVLGTIADGELEILNLYADRYLIHNDLCQTVILGATATQSDFSDEDDRDLISGATENLMELQKNSQTKVTDTLIERSLREVKQSTIDRLLGLEDAASTPKQGAVYFVAVRDLLLTLGYGPKEIPELVTNVIQESYKQVVRKVYKVGRHFAAATNPRGAAAEEVRRLSMMVELEEVATDKDSVSGKGRVLVRLLEQIFQPLIKACQFATASRHAGVTAIVICRIDATLAELAPALKGTVQNFVTAVSEAPLADPNPLGDSCGALLRVLDVVVELVDAIHLLHQNVRGSATGALDSHCQMLIELTNPFFPLWFHLCDQKRSFWVTTIVKHAPLTPMSPTKGIFYNDIPSDVQNIVQSLQQVFHRALHWSDPSCVVMHVSNFAKAVSMLIEELSGALLMRGMRCKTLPECMVCLATYFRLCEMTVSNVWVEVILRSVIHTELGNVLHDEAPDPTVHGVDVFVEAQIKESEKSVSHVFKSTMDVLQESMVSFVDSVAQRLGTLLRNTIKETILPVMSVPPSASTTKTSFWPFDKQKAAKTNTAAAVSESSFEERVQSLQAKLEQDGFEMMGHMFASPSANRNSNSDDDESDDPDDGGEDIFSKYAPTAAKRKVQILTPRSAAARERKKRDTREIEHMFDHCVEGMSMYPEQLRLAVARDMFRTFRDFALTFGATPLSSETKQQFMEILEVLERVLKDWSNGECEEVTRLAHSQRSFVFWLCHSSNQLIQLATSSSVDELGASSRTRDSAPLVNPQETEALVKILRCREDKEAQKYCKNSF